MANMNPILQAARVHSAQTEQARWDLQADNTGIQESFALTDERLAQNAGMAGVASREKSAFKKEAEDSLQRSASQLNTDLADATGRQARLAEQILAGMDAKERAMSQIEAKKNTNFFDDPVGFMANLVTIDDDIRTFNSASSSVERGQQNMQTLNALTSQRAKTVADLTRTTSDALADAEATTAVNNAMLLKDQAARQAYLANSEAVLKIQRLTGEDMQTRMQVFNAEVQMQHLADAQERLGMARAQHAASLGKMKEDEKSDEYLKNTILLGMKKMYPGSPEKWVVPDEAMLMMKGKIPVSPFIKEMYTQGEQQRMVDPSGKSRVMADSPSTMSQLLRYHPDLGPGQDKVVSLIKDTEASIGKDPEFMKARDAKDEAGMRKAFDSAVKRKLIAQADNTQDPGSLFYLPSIVDIAKQNPGMQELGLYQKVIGPLAEAGVDFTDPARVYAQGLQAVAEKKISLNEFATDFATLYAHAQQQNLHAKNAAGFGLPVKTTYKMKVPGTFGTTSVETTSSEEVKRKAMTDLYLRGESNTGIAPGTAYREGLKASYESMLSPFLNTERK